MSDNIIVVVACIAFMAWLVVSLTWPIRRRRAVEVVGTMGASCTDVPALPVSELIGSATGGTLLLLNPKPLHPRPIEGEEVRASPPVPMRTPQDYHVLLMWSQREYAKRRSLAS